MRSRIRGQREGIRAGLGDLVPAQPRCVLLQWLISQQVSFSRDPAGAPSSEQLQGNSRSTLKGLGAGAWNGQFGYFITAVTEPRSLGWQEP